MDSEIKKSILKTGTTILGIVCKDGIVMAGDRRGSVGDSLIYNKNTKKVSQLNDYLVFSGCGAATEIQKVSKILTAELRLKQLKSKTRPPVRQAAGLLSNIPVQVSAFILAGIDEDKSVHLYDILGGFLEEVSDYTASVGSGMPYALGYLERSWKSDLSVEEGIQIAKEALKASMSRDMGSGNGMDIYTLTKEGIKKVVSQEIQSSFKED